MASLTMDLLHAKTESSHAVEDLIRGLDPFEGRVALVVGVDVRQDGRAQLRNARVRSAFQRLLGKQAEEALHEIEPRGVGWREMTLRCCGDLDDQVSFSLYLFCTWTRVFERI
jgi:hypothetical protein